MEPTETYLAVARLVDGVEVAASVDRVPPALVLPGAGREHAVHHGHEGGGAVGHRRVDHLALARALRFEQAAHHAEREVEPAAAEVADEVEGGDGGAAPRADRVQRAGEGDVVDVVPGRVGDGSFLAPARHPAVDEAGVAHEAFVGADAEALRDPGAETFDEAVRLGHEPEHRLAAGLGLHVDGDGAPSPVEEVVARVALHPEPRIRHPVHPDDVRAHVREHHRAHRPRADARQLHDPEACERSHPRHLLLLHPRGLRWYIKLPRADGAGSRTRSRTPLPAGRCAGWGGSGDGADACPESRQPRAGGRGAVSPNRAGSPSRCRG